jgi:hypothetical protein
MPHFSSASVQVLYHRIVVQQPREQAFLSLNVRGDIETRREKETCLLVINMVATRRRVTRGKSEKYEIGDKVEVSTCTVGRIWRRLGTRTVCIGGGLFHAKAAAH